MVSTRGFQISIGFILLLVILTNSNIGSSKQPDLIDGTSNFDPITKTAFISKNNGQLEVSIKQLSYTPDLTTMEETFNVTSYRNNLKLKDLKITTNHLKLKGQESIFRVDWYILVNTSYTAPEDVYGEIGKSVVINGITNATNVTDAWGTSNTPVQYGSNNGLYKWNFSNRTTNFTPDWDLVGFDIFQNQTGDTYPINTLFSWNETAIINTKQATKYRTEWIPLNKDDTSTKLDAGDSVILKVIYHKKAEEGTTSIQTVPSFYDVQIPELTWWNSSWSNSIHNTISNGARPYVQSLNITNSTGTNNNTHIFVSCSLTNCTDLRFTLDNTTELPYWFETNTSDTATWGKVWVNLTANGTVNAYYGNSATIWASSKTNTFIQYLDGTDAGNWTPSGTMTITNINGGLSFEGAHTATRSFPTIPGNVIIEARANSAIGALHGMTILTGDTTIANDRFFDIDFPNTQSDDIGYYPDNYGTFVTMYGTQVGYTYYRFKLDFRHTQAKVDRYVYTDAGVLLASDLNGGTDLYGTAVNFTTYMVGDGSSGAIHTHANISYIRIRPYAATEPVWATWGAEQLGITLPTITDWSNNATNNPSSTPRINMSAGINFNVTSDQTITTWTWYKDGVNQNTNFNNFSTSWSTLGVKTIDATATNVNGTTANKTWTVTVSDITKPWLTSESVSSPSGAIGSTVLVTANFMDDTNTSTATFMIKSPNGTDTNLTMSCTPSGNSSSCTYTYGDTPSSGTYTVMYWYAVDGSNNVSNISSALTYIVNPTPTITSWLNNITTPNTELTPRINMSAGIYFFVASDQTITTWSWYKDGVNQNSNTDDFSTSWSTLGVKTIDATATNVNGTTANKTWTVTVSDITNPWFVNDSLSLPAIMVNGSETLSGNFTDDTNISSILYRIRAPNGTESEYSMSCTPVGNTSTCTSIITDTSNAGTYTVLWYKMTDGSSNTANASSSKTFVVTSAPTMVSWSNSITNNNTLSAIRVNISTSGTFSVTATGEILDYSWYKDGTKTITTSNSYGTSWNTLGTKNISVTARSTFGTSELLTWILNVSDITAPWLSSASTDSADQYVYSYPVTITAIFSDDTNISSAKALIRNPDASEGNYSMTCGVASSTVTCTYNYLTTNSIGEYTIPFFYPKDSSNNEGNRSSTLSFLTIGDQTGGSTGDTSSDETSSGGGGGAARPSQPDAPTPIPTEAPDMTLGFTDITEGATEPQAIDIAKCLTDSLVMQNKCSSFNYGVVVEPFNWWVAIGGYLAALGVIIFQSIRHDTKKEWLQETLLYGTITVIATAILVSVGFNAYILNYIIDSPKYFYTFLNFGMWGGIVAIIGDSYYYRKKQKKYKLKIKSPLDDLLK